MLAKVAPAHRTYDLKVATLLGLESLFLEETQQRTRRHATLEDGGPSTGTVSLRREEFLLRAYALHRRALPALRKTLKDQGGYLLHVDGTETAGSPVVFVAWDEWSGLVLDARVLDTENADEIAAFFRELEAALGRPRGLVSDMGTGILKAVRQVWSGLPLQLCQFHYVRDVGKDLFEKLEGEVRRKLLGTRVLARLNELTPGKEEDWQGSGRRCAEELERLLEDAEPRWMRILQDHVLGPRERASRFPFELTYGTIARQVWSVAPLVHELAMWNVGRTVLLGSLAKADGLLGKLAEDGEFTRLAYRVKTLTEAFGEYREALGVGRDVTGSDGEAVAVAAAEERRQVEEVLGRWEGVAEGIDDEEVRQGVRQRREAWEKRKGNLFVEVRDLRGRWREIERTNWRSEQTHREIRLSIRGRTRKGRTEEEMTRHGALMAVVGNWSREGYAKAMGWEREDIVRAMGTVSKEKLSEARRLKGRTRRCRSDVARAKHRDPMLREFLGILRKGSPTMREEIRAWMARREPLRQPLV